MDTKEVEVITTAQLIQEGIAKGSNLEALEKILQLREKDDAFKARKAYARAFAIAQANILPVVKSKFNKQTNSNYAELSNIIETAQPIYTKEGFSVTFNEGDCPKENHARILADVLHLEGHKEQYRLDVPLDGTGIKGNANMTPIHGKASSISYGKKYLMCMIWNIPTSDDDSNKASIKKFVSDSQLHILRDLLIVKELTEGSFIKFLKIEKLEELPESRYMEAMAAINAKVKTVKI